MNILFTICARAGSKGLKNKNLKKLGDYSLLEHTLSVIDLYVKLNKIKGYNNRIDICVNTDSDELNELVKKYKTIIHIPRKANLAGDTVSKITVIKDTMQEAEKILNNKYNFIIDLDLTSPIRTLNDLNSMISTIDNNDDLDVVFSVVKSRRSPYFNMVQESNGGYRLVKDTKFTTRQETPNVFDMNASMYIYRRQFLINSNRIFDGKCGIIEMNDYLVLDIDSEDDYDWMSYIYQRVLQLDYGVREVYNNIENITL
ncbi:cytidylyltransferase domain-containing protein [Finegoldia magna]|uniref:cytidylyltransferase domain-containing protein n=1 Tax=Finegoldia magna TaxID=1260 RepID=UPI003F80A5D0